MSTIEAESLPATRSPNPWLFVPVLYFMQFIPYGVVTSLFAPLYKSLGVDNLRIATWTGLAALPWTFKMFWGPLVDLNSTKRRWTIAMQALLSITLLATAGALSSTLFFPLTVIALFVLGTLSATHDIACDGLYLMSLDRTRQAAFSGLMSAFSRLGRLFLDAGVVVIAGHLITLGYQKQTAWLLALGIAALVYAAGALWNFFALPHPPADLPAADIPPGQRIKDIFRTLTIVAFGVAVYYLIAGSLSLLGHTIASYASPGSVPKDWLLNHSQLSTQYWRIGAGLVLAPLLAILIRILVRGTAMAQAFTTYFRQPGFPAILSFIIFYRFGESMITFLITVFLLDPKSKGGMGLTLEQLGVIKGIGQVLGLLLGGLLGGWFISRVGLRRAFWPLVIGMHLPNLLYVWAAYTLPNKNWLYPIVFLEAFGYGIGFAGYFVFLMQVAQRNKFVTSHYAIGTGLGSLFISFAFILAGIIQSVLGYKGAFLAACLFTLPGTLTLLLIPLDPEAPTPQPSPHH
ncbi:MAG TPA: MFS transporter [Tepidisphaeraceae bacterium]|nr:MFS transporter [Tepidisphaeraceae bacterium]